MSVAASPVATPAPRATRGPALTHAAFAIVLAVAAVLRLSGLGWLPSPAGDEGNWTLYGLRILHGEPAALAPDAAFVSLLYARLIAVSMSVLGPTFTAARLVGALAVLLAIVVVYLVFGWLGSWRAGLAAAAMIAVHPWAVLYARIASVPYGLAFALLVAGPLLFAAGVLRERMAMVAAGVLVTGSAIHFSPLSLVGAAACGLFALHPARRWVLRRPATWIAVALTAVHVGPVLLRGGARGRGRAGPAPAHVLLAERGRIRAHDGHRAHGRGHPASLHERRHVRPRRHGAPPAPGRPRGARRLRTGAAAARPLRGALLRGGPPALAVDPGPGAQLVPAREPHGPLRLRGPARARPARGRGGRGATAACARRRWRSSWAGCASAPGAPPPPS